MPINDLSFRNVYKCIIPKLKPNADGKIEPHFIPIVAKYSENSYFMLAVIISTYNYLRVLDCKISNGDNSYVILEEDDYSELKHKSFIDCEVLKVPKNLFRNEDKRSKINNELLRRIKDAAFKHRFNTLGVKMDLA